MKNTFTEYLNEEVTETEVITESGKIPKQFSSSLEMEASLDHICNLLDGPFKKWAKDSNSKSVKALSKAREHLDAFFYSLDDES